MPSDDSVNPLLDAALQYAARGWRVMPLHNPIFESESGAVRCSCKAGVACRSIGKHPRIKTGQAFAAATCEPAVIEQWWSRWPAANVGLATGRGLVVLDVDGARGAATLKRLVGDHEALPATLLARSGRAEGGRHAYFTVAGEVRNSEGEGLELRGDGGLAVAPPSLHASGRRYSWVDGGAGLSAAPGWLLAWLGTREGSKKARAASAVRAMPAWLRDATLHRLADRALAELVEDVPAGDLAAVAAAMPNEDLEWGAWNERLMAFWACSDGSEAGRGAALAWSRKSSKHTDEALAERWEHYASSPPRELGYGSLVWHARQAAPGWQPPSREPKIMSGGEELGATVDILPDSKEESEENRGFFEVEEGKVNGHKSLSKLFNEIDLDEPGNPLIKLNEKYAVIGDVGGKCLVLGWVKSKVDEVVRVPSFQSFKSFAERYASRYVVVKREGKDGEIIEEAKPLGAWWLKWGGRRSFEGMDLVPGGAEELPGGYLNLWQGFGAGIGQEVSGGAVAGQGWPLMRRHVLEVLADGDRASADYVVRWAAWAVQHPGERAEVALVLKGGKGSGKGTFGHAMRQVFGQHGLHISNAKHLIGSFNAHMRNCLLLFADEAFWAGDKAGESTLKAIVSEPVMMIEQKGVDATQWRNRMHIIMTANADWVVPASHDERRYAVFDVSDRHVGDEKYFRDLNAEIRGGGLGAMLRDLLAVDLKGWHPRRIIQTVALQKQKERSMDPLSEWWETLLQDGLPLAAVGDIVAAGALLQIARESSPRLRETSAAAFGRFVSAVGCIKVHRHDGNYWRLPFMADARAAWDKKYRGWPFKLHLNSFFRQE